jgi:ankyrin repeat protein
VNRTCTDEKITPLLAALKSGRGTEQLINLVQLLHYHGADVNVMGENGHTPLYQAWLPDDPDRNLIKSSQCLKAKHVC